MKNENNWIWISNKVCNSPPTNFNLILNHPNLYLRFVWNPHPKIQKHEFQCFINEAFMEGWTINEYVFLQGLNNRKHVQLLQGLNKNLTRFWSFDWVLLFKIPMIPNFSFLLLCISSLIMLLLICCWMILFASLLPLISPLYINAT